LSAGVLSELVFKNHSLFWEESENIVKCPPLIYPIHLMQFRTVTVSKN